MGLMIDEEICILVGRWTRAATWGKFEVTTPKPQALVALGWCGDFTQH